MGTPGRAPSRSISGRSSQRCPLAVPVRLTALRGGNAYSIPGRSINLGEGGIGVVLAGDVRPGDAVGVEFPLPEVGLGVQAKAVVRHQGPMRCGLQFQELTRYQQALIREWTRQALGASAPSSGASPSASAGSESSRAAEPGIYAWFSDQTVQRLLWILAALLLLGSLFAWWNWQRGWKELEDRLPRNTAHIQTDSPARPVTPAGNSAK